VLLGHYHVHTRVNRGIWYAGSTDTFSFADDPDRPKGVVVLDTDTGECRHVPLTGRRPLVTLETVHALGLAPAEVQELVLERAAGAPDGSVARLYVEAIDPEAWRLLDAEAIRDAARQALVFKLEPTFADATGMVELPELDSMPARWGRYVDEQDLPGYDRDRIRDLGTEYIVRAVEEAIE
jgi:DNA repair exonuclease SbcCD nuclease subunit